MDEITGTVTEAVKETAEEKSWRDHVVAAVEFSGTDREYCRLHGLKFGKFKIYKRTFGLTRPRGRPAKAFLKIERGETQATPVLKTARVREVSLPDPGWTADFIAALMRAR